MIEPNAAFQRTKEHCLMGYGVLTDFLTRNKYILDANLEIFVSSFIK